LLAFPPFFFLPPPFAGMIVSVSVYKKNKRKKN